MKYAFSLAFLFAFISCSKSENTPPKILLSGKVYEAFWIPGNNQPNYIANIRFISEDTLIFHATTIFEAETTAVETWRLNYTFDQSSRVMSYGNLPQYYKYMEDSLIKFRIRNDPPYEGDTAVDFVFYKVE